VRMCVCGCVCECVHCACVLVCLCACVHCACVLVCMCVCVHVRLCACMGCVYVWRDMCMIVCILIPLLGKPMLKRYLHLKHLMSPKNGYRQYFIEMQVSVTTCQSCHITITGILYVPEHY